MSLIDKIKEDDINLSEEQRLPILNRAKANLDYSVKPKKINKYLFRILTPAISVLLICITIFSLITAVNDKSYKEYNTITNTLYVDINPSIEFSLNKYEKVINAKALNSDGEKILASYSFKDMYIEDAVDKLLEALNDNDYFNDSHIYFSVLDEGSKSLLDKVVTKVEASKEENSYSITVEFKILTEDDVINAIDELLSPVKYALIESIIEYDDSYTVDDLKDKTMTELFNILDEAKRNYYEKLLEDLFGETE